MVYTGDQKRAYQLAWIKSRRDAWIASKGGVCANCSSGDKLEVDHIDRSTKKFEPAAIWSRREEIRNEELAKCQVLCYDCHLSKTIKEIEQWMGKADHGSHSMYNHNGCRCNPCKTAHSDLARATRALGKKW